MAEPVNIDGRPVGPGQPVFVIAEAGVNHNGDLDTAKKLIEVAADAGADAVKFQTLNATKLVMPGAPKADYQVATTGSEESQFEMIRNLELSGSDHRQLKDLAETLGLIFMSTPFDEDSADFLDDLGVSLFKIGSGEVTNWPLLAHIGKKGKPVILSTGMSTLDEVRGAVAAVTGSGNRSLAILHCVSNYPADPSDVNLSAMSTMARTFDYPIGYSDHTMGIEVPVAAVAMGATIIEKHFTLDRTMAGPDHTASLEPGDLGAMIQAIRVVESAIGDGIKSPADSEESTRSMARRSLVTRVALAKGTVITAEALIALRPGTGIPPSALEEVAGRRASRDLPEQTLLAWDDLE